MKRLPPVIKTFLSQELEKLKAKYPDDNYQEDYLTAYYYNKRLHEVLNKVLEKLSERERDCIILKYIQGKTYKEIGQCYYNTSPDRIREIIERACRKLTKYFEVDL